MSDDAAGSTFNEVLFVPCHPVATDQRSWETKNDDAAMFSAVIQCSVHKVDDVGRGAVWPSM
jgi:hypothetical protein